MRRTQVTEPPGLDPGAVWLCLGKSNMKIGMRMRAGICSFVFLG